MRVGGEVSALLDLILEEIGCFEHWITTTKAPLTGASMDQKRGGRVFVPIKTKIPNSPLDNPSSIEPAALR
ncbi:MAG: hypothetical protein WAL37_16885 [Xanthobacteraceae bacterium]